MSGNVEIATVQGNGLHVPRSGEVSIEWIQTLPGGNVKVPVKYVFDLNGIAVTDRLDALKVLCKMNRIPTEVISFN